MMPLGELAHLLEAKPSVQVCASMLGLKTAGITGSISARVRADA
jgi:hypothetical protein